MSTPRYDALVAKVRDWSNKPAAQTIPDSVIQDCLGYSADECYRKLRIPPLEYTIKYTIEAADNAGENSMGLPYGNAYTSFSIPEDLTQFCYVRTVAQDNLETAYSTYPSNVSKMFNEVTDKRSFFDAYAEKYSPYNWMWMDNKIFIHPQLAVGAVVEINYYRRLPALDALYAVVPENYLIGVPNANQPYLNVEASGTPLYFATSAGVQRCFATSALAALYNPVVTQAYFSGKEVENWLRDNQEKLLIWGALYNLGAYLFDDKMEARYGAKFVETIDGFNREETKRRATGGNVQINLNTGGML
jgi:hypothetical protein